MGTGDWFFRGERHGVDDNAIGTPFDFVDLLGLGPDIQVLVDDP